MPTELFKDYQRLGLQRRNFLLARKPVPTHLEQEFTKISKLFFEEAKRFSEIRKYDDLNISQLKRKARNYNLKST